MTCCKLGNESDVLETIACIADDASGLALACIRLHKRVYTNNCLTLQDAFQVSSAVTCHQDKLVTKVICMVLHEKKRPGIADVLHRFARA